MGVFSWGVDPSNHPRGKGQLINRWPEEVDLVSNNFASPLFVPLWPGFLADGYMVPFP